MRQSPRKKLRPPLRAFGKLRQVEARVAHEPVALNGVDFLQHAPSPAVEGLIPRAAQRGGRLSNGSFRPPSPTPRTGERPCPTPPFRGGAPVGRRIRKRYFYDRNPPLREIENPRAVRLLKGYWHRLRAGELEFEGSQNFSAGGTFRAADGEPAYFDLPPEIYFQMIFPACFRPTFPRGDRRPPSPENRGRRAQDCGTARARNKPEPRRKIRLFQTAALRPRREPAAARKSKCRIFRPANGISPSPENPNIRTSNTAGVVRARNENFRPASRRNQPKPRPERGSIRTPPLPPAIPTDMFL